MENRKKDNEEKFACESAYWMLIFFQKFIYSNIFFSSVIVNDFKICFQFDYSLIKTNSFTFLNETKRVVV